MTNRFRAFGGYAIGDVFGAIPTESSEDTSSSGYQQIPGTSLLMQWGIASQPSDDAITVNLPVTFADASFSVTLGQETGASFSASSLDGHRIDNKTTTSFDIDRDSNIDGESLWNWQAIGLASSTEAPTADAYAFSSFAASLAPVSLSLQGHSNTSGVVADVGVSAISYESSSWSSYPVSISENEVWASLSKTDGVNGSTSVTGLSPTLVPDGNPILGRDKGTDSWIFSSWGASTSIRALTGAMTAGDTVQIDALKYQEMDTILALPTDIIITFGQSLGLGTDDYMDNIAHSWTDARMSVVHMTSDDSIVAGLEYPLCAPINHQNGGRSGVCPIVTMGKDIEGFTQDGRRTTFVAANWAGSDLIGGLWEPDVGAAYLAMVAQVDALLAASPAGSRVILGIWDHGQSEYANLASGAYQSAVMALIAAVRTRYGDMPIFVSGNIPAATATLSQELIDAQASLDSDSGSQYAIADCTFVPRTAAMQTIDGTHPRGVDQDTHGRNLAAAFISRFNL